MIILCALVLISSAIGASDVLTLDSCLSLARKNHVELRKAQMEVERAQLVKNQMLTKFFPQVKATALGYHSLHPLVDVGIDDIGNATVRDLLNTLYGNYGAALGLENHLALFQYGYHAGVTAIQPVFLGGKIIAANQLAKTGVEAAELQQQMAERDILEQVEESYWLVVSLQDKRRTLLRTQALLDTLYNTVNAAVNAGLALPTDRMQVEMRQDEVHALALQLKNATRLATQALCLAIDIPAVDSLMLDTVAPISSLTNPQLPENELLALQLRAAQYQYRLTLSDALPQLAVGANYGYGRLSTNVLRNDLGNPTGNGAVFVTLTVPLTQWWETAYKLKADKIAIETAQLTQYDTERKLQLRDQQTRDQLAEAQQLYEACQKTLRTTEENYRLMLVNYRAGTATIAELLHAETMLLQAQNRQTDARTALLLAQRKYQDLCSH